jgi:hypothetical protein
LAYWHREVVPNIPDLHGLAYPPPGADIDAVRVQNSGQPSPADRIGHPARECWFRYERLLERQSAASERIEQITGTYGVGSVWHRFSWAVARRTPDRLADDLPCPQAQWIHDEHPDVWDEIHSLLLDMDVLRAAAWKLIRAGAGPAWKAGDSGLTKDQKRYLVGKLHDRQARGLSPISTEKGTGLQ